MGNEDNVVKVDFLGKYKQQPKQPVPPPASLPEEIRRLISAAQDAAVGLDMMAWEDASPVAGEYAQSLWAAIEEVERTYDAN
jgi:hypothetical protein